MINNIKIRPAKQKIMNMTEKCVMSTAVELINFANLYYVPIRTGRLQNSAWVTKGRKQPDCVSASVSYGRSSGLRGTNPYVGAIRTAEPVSAGGTDISKQRSSYGGVTYALDVHETNRNYNFGRQYHYLSDPIMHKGDMCFAIGIQKAFK